MERVPYQKRLKEALVRSFSGSDLVHLARAIKQLVPGQHLHLDNIRFNKL